MAKLLVMQKLISKKIEVMSKFSALALMLVLHGGAFAAQELAPEPPPVSKEQAAHMLAREFRLTEDQQKRLRAQLDEMSQSGKFRGYVGTFRGYVDMSAAREVALGIKEMPTQAGPAVVKAGEAEEKEEKEEGEKVGKAIVKTPERANVERVVSEFLPPKLVSSLVGDYAVSVAPWNIKFGPGEVSTQFECGGFESFQASADGRYIAIVRDSKGYGHKEIEIWDMQKMQLVQRSVMDMELWVWKLVLSPSFDMAAGLGDEREIVVVNLKDHKVVKRIPIGIGLNQKDHYLIGNSLRFFHAEGGLRFIAADSHNTIFMWDVASGSLIDKKEVQFAVPGIRLVHFSPDGQLFLARGDGERSLFVGKVATGELIQEIELNINKEGAIFGQSYAFDFDNQRVAALIVSKIDSQQILIWDLRANKQLYSIDIGEEENLLAVAMAFAPRGDYLLSGQRGQRKAFFFDLEACEREYREKVARGDMIGIITGRVEQSRQTVDDINEKFKEEVTAFAPEQRSIWEIELNKLASQSLDHKVELGAARNLLMEMASAQNF